MSSDTINLQKSPEDIFPELQNGITSARQTIKTIVPNQTIVSEGKREYSNLLMVVLILFLWPGAIVYYFTSERTTLTVIVTKHGDTGSTITINSNGKVGDEITKYIFHNLQKDSEMPEYDKKEEKE